MSNQYKDNTKYGNVKFSNVPNRPNKVAKGFTKHYEGWESLGRVRISNDKHPDYNKRGTSREILNLIVNGTTDTLRCLGIALKKKVKIEHPLDKGYFKEVYILTEAGKRRLMILKAKRING